MVDREELQSIDSYFESIRRKSNVDASLRGIERVLNRLFDYVFSVKIVPPSSFETPFFGMNVYPDKDKTREIVGNIVDKKSSNEIKEAWAKCESWFIEIDYKLLYNQRLAASPQEMTAVLLHEVGHTVYSNTIPQRLHKVMMLKFIKSAKRLQELCKRDNFRIFLGAAILGACESKSFRYVSEKQETEADKFVVSCGYGEHLDSLITKVITCYGNKDICKTDAELDDDIRALMTWGLDNIESLQMRKTKLRNELALQIKMCKSFRIKDYYLKIEDKFFGHESIGQMVVAEQALKTEYERVDESLREFFENFHKVKKVTRRDLDIIQIEMDRIENTDDKYYVLDLIYEKLNVVNLGLEYYAKGQGKKCSQSEATLKELKKELEEKRKYVVNLELVEKQYGLFIKVPKGYEG